MQRRATAQTRGRNTAEKRFHQYLADTEFCITCLSHGPVELDHVIGATGRINKVLVGHWFVIPVCHSCHTSLTKHRWRHPYSKEDVDKGFFARCWAMVVEDAKQLGSVVIDDDVQAAIAGWGRL